MRASSGFHTALRPPDMAWETSDARGRLPHHPGRGKKKSWPRRLEYGMPHQDRDDAPMTPPVLDPWTKKEELWL